MADTLEIINCPACGKEMKKIFMPVQGVNLDVCIDGCGGIYFDNRELKKFDAPCEDITPLLEIFEGKSFEKIDEEKARICPVCGSEMVKNFTSYKHDVQIDECYNCGAKFLDYGELDKIREDYDSKEETTASIIKELYNSIGVDLEKLDDECLDLDASPQSILSKIIKIKSGKYNFIEKYKKTHIQKCSILGGIVGVLFVVIAFAVIMLSGQFEENFLLLASEITENVQGTPLEDNWFFFIGLIPIVFYLFGVLIGNIIGILTANKAAQPKPLEFN